MKTKLFYAILVAASVCLQSCTPSYAKDKGDAKETSSGERLEISFLTLTMRHPTRECHVQEPPTMA